MALIVSDSNNCNHIFIRKQHVATLQLMKKKQNWTTAFMNGVTRPNQSC